MDVLYRTCCLQPCPGKNYEPHSTPQWISNPRGLGNLIFIFNLGVLLFFIENHLEAYFYSVLKVSVTVEAHSLSLQPPSYLPDHYLLFSLSHIASSLQASGGDHPHSTPAGLNPLRMPIFQQVLSLVNLWSPIAQSCSNTLSHGWQIRIAMIFLVIANLFIVTNKNTVWNPIHIFRLKILSFLFPRSTSLMRKILYCYRIHWFHVFFFWFYVFS